MSLRLGDLGGGQTRTWARPAGRRSPREKTGEAYDPSQILGSAELCARWSLRENRELALGSRRMFEGLEGPRPSPADMWLKQVYLPRMRASHPARRIVTPLSAPEQAA